MAVIMAPSDEWSNQIGSPVCARSVSTPHGIGSSVTESLGWNEAFASERPVVVDALTDPSVPPLPPHIDISQATAYAKAIFKGDPDAWDTVMQSIKGVSSTYKERLRELVD